MLTHYVLERLFYRLSQTEHRSSFILKGTMLLTKWFDDPLRPTQDLDFRGFGNDDPDEMVKRSGSGDKYLILLAEGPWTDNP
ncbi:nucleotidyl transferase AbiEii/AbiGii toxin family protein [Tardiphaga sp. 804_B3_N1_9]|uniref:nucleotidyl transferase AbiEii/AbiGii toxin family protein n=1 Tax=Tardiphaga sp. 804_B3_N1_9 TaxID=3240786 RepID=UPI003F2674BA